MVPGSFGCGSVVFEAMTMFAPSRAARSAIALPIPRLAPVMKRVLSLRSGIVCIGSKKPKRYLHSEKHYRKQSSAPRLSGSSTHQTYSPLKTGGRFSMNAMTASARSFDCRNDVFQSAT